MQTYQECLVEGALNITSLFTFSRQKFACNYRFVGESHDFIEVVCVLEGKVGVTAGKDIFVLSAGQMVVHPAGEFHAIWSDHGTSPDSIIFSFRADAFPALTRKIHPLSQEAITELKDLYREATTIFTLQKNDVKCVNPYMGGAVALFLKKLELLLLNAFHDNLEEETKYVSQSAENYARILSVMERNLSEKRTVEELAAACNISVPTLERTVYRYLRCGAMSYYNHLKMRRAEQLLLKGLSVKEVALSLGFSNQNYFSTCYKKWSGNPPSSVGK